MSLHHDVTGPGRRLVLAHGFTQNRRCWGPFGADLATDHEVVAVDLPGHGRTPPHHDTADLPTAAGLVADVGGRAVYVGYSMGGRVALHLALAYPELVEALVLIGATAGIDEAEARAARVEADLVLAARLLTGGLPAFLDGWLANPLFAGLSPESAAVPARLENRPQGLAASLRHCGTGTQEPLWARLGEIGAPVLVVAGRDDAKFTELGRRLVDGLPHGQMTTVPGSHAVQLANPAATAAAVRHFVAAVL